MLTVDCWLSLLFVPCFLGVAWPMLVCCLMLSASRVNIFQFYSMSSEPPPPPPSGTIISLRDLPIRMIGEVSWKPKRRRAWSLLCTKYTYIFKVPQCMSPRRNWGSRTPSLASECAPTPATKAGGHTCLRVNPPSTNEFFFEFFNHFSVKYSLGPPRNKSGNFFFFLNRKYPF